MGPAPWVANVNSFGYTGIAGITTTPATYKRNNLIIVNKPTTDPTALRAANPAAIILFYINSTQLTVNNATNGVPTTAGMSIYPGWWLTNTGTQLQASIIAGTTTLTTGVPITAWPSTPFPVLVSDQTRANQEVMVVTATSLTGSVYTLTVTRGNWNSTALAFSAGARVAALQVVPSFPTTYYMNITPFCPRSGVGSPGYGTGPRWIEYLASFIQSAIATFPEYDGVFLDSSNTYLNPAVNNADADAGNQADPFGLSTNQIGGDGPTPGAPVYNASGVLQLVASGRGIYNGEVALLKALRALPTNAPRVIMTNGSGYPPFTDGMFHENIFTSNFSSPPTFYNQFKLSNALATACLDRSKIGATVINPCVWTTSAGAVTGGNSNAYSYSYPNMRIGLAIACLSNTYAAYAWSTLFHGQTWVFDEYYAAKGAALANAVLNTDTTLTLGTGGGAKFKNGDVVRVPHAVLEVGGTYSTNCEDETMTVTGVAGDVLTVTRSNTVKGTQIVGTAVFTDAHWAAGAGWLGNPKGAAVNNIGNLGAAVFSEDFELPAVGQGAVVAQTPTGWTFTATGAGIPGQGVIYGDASTFATGSQSVLVTVSTGQANNGAFTFFNTKLTRNVPITVTANNPVTVTFWAKGDRSQVMSLRMQTTGSVTVNTQQFFLTPDWSQYIMAYTPTAGDTGVIFQFEFGAESGRYWLDGVKLYNGDGNIWYRDFDNGLVVLNGSAYNANDTTHGQGTGWALPAVTSNAGQGFTTYRRLTGSQDPTVNSGAALASGSIPSIPSLDALFLLKV